MPHFADNIARQLNPRNYEDLQTQVREFEQSVGAPVRVLYPGDGRTVAGMLSGWSGSYANMDNYPGFTEQDRDDKGITIMFGSWNSEVHVGPSYYDNVYLPAEMFEEYTRTREAEIEVRTPEMTVEQIENAGGIPLVAQRSNGADCIYGELYENGRLVFLRMAVGQYTNWARGNYQALIFNAIMENFSEESREAARIRREEMQRELFTRLMEDQGNLAVIELRKRAADTSSIIGEAEVTLTNARIDAEQIGRQLAYLLDEQGELSREEIQEEWDAIQKHASVASFTMGKGGGSELERQRQRRRREERGEPAEGAQSNAWLKLKTKLLWITHPETGRKVPLGEFEITLDFGNNTLHIKNMTNAQQEGRWDHPHVERGRLCAADYGSTITELLRARKLAGMTGMVFAILKTLTMADVTAVNNMRQWEETDDRVRRENGWPAWQEGEDEHPMITTNEEDNDGDSESGDTPEEESADASEEAETNE